MKFSEKNFSNNDSIKIPPSSAIGVLENSIDQPLPPFHGNFQEATKFISDLVIEDRKKVEGFINLGLFSLPNNEAVPPFVNKNEYEYQVTRVLDDMIRSAKNDNPGIDIKKSDLGDSSDWPAIMVRSTCEVVVYPVDGSPYKTPIWTIISADDNGNYYPTPWYQDIGIRNIASIEFVESPTSNQ